MTPDVEGQAPSQESKPAFDWNAVTGHQTDRLRAPKVTPVDPAIVKQAQRSWDEGTVLGHEFPSQEIAAEFARLIKKAGDHTTPQTSVSAVPDPNREGNLRLVHWRAGARRGRSTS